MNGFWQRGAGFMAGIVLVFLGMSMLIPGQGMPATGPFVAMASVLTALGIGIVAAAALPHELKIHGDNIQPLGVSVSASGGAAVFLVALAFLFYWEPGSRIEPAGKAVAAEAAEESDTDKPDEKSAEELAIEDPEPERTTAATRTQAPVSRPPKQSEERAARDGDVPSRAESSGQFDFIEEAQEPTGLYRYATYCPLQCPGGPEFCPSLAWGQHAQRITAQEIAVSYCVGAGGDETCCRSNLEAF